MSADNWTVCPRCSQNYVSAIDAAKTALKEAYGKVTIEEYNKLLVKLKEAEEENEEEPQTLREDYSQGIRDGEYFVGYRGHCSVCDFNFDYEHTVNVI